MRNLAGLKVALPMKRSMRVSGAMDLLLESATEGNVGGLVDGTHCMKASILQAAIVCDVRDVGRQESKALC